MKCSVCGLMLVCEETRKTKKWIRRMRICKNKHKVTTRQEYGSPTETIVRLSHSVVLAKPGMSFANPFLNVAAILQAWSNSGEKEPEQN